MTIITSPAVVSNAALTEDTQVTAMAPIASGVGQVPQGALGTVIAQFGSGATCEVLFGPPVSATETVSETLLAIA